MTLRHHLAQYEKLAHWHHALRATPWKIEVGFIGLRNCGNGLAISPLGHIYRLYLVWRTGRPVGTWVVNEVAQEPYRTAQQLEDDDGQDPEMTRFKPERALDSPSSLMGYLQDLESTNSEQAVVKERMDEAEHAMRITKQLWCDSEQLNKSGTYTGVLHPCLPVNFDDGYAEYRGPLADTLGVRCTNSFVPHLDHRGVFLENWTPYHKGNETYYDLDKAEHQYRLPLTGHVPVPEIAKLLVQTVVTWDDQLEAIRNSCWSDEAWQAWKTEKARKVLEERDSSPNMTVVGLDLV